MFCIGILPLSAARLPSDSRRVLVRWNGILHVPDAPVLPLDVWQTTT
jgi:hypothetical protein